MLKLKKEDYPTPPDDIYNAEVTDVSEFTSEKHPEFGTSIRFTFRITDEPYAGALVSGLVSAVWRPGNKLDAWLTGLGIDSTSIGDELTLEQLKGRRVRVYVKKDPKSGYTNVKDVHKADAKLASAPKVTPAAQNTPPPVVNTPPTTPQPQVQVNPSPKRVIPF
jgi:hypothetical protein